MLRIKLLSDHTHHEQPHVAGEIIEVDEVAGKWLVKHDLGRITVAHQKSDAPAGSPAKKEDV